MDNKVFLIYEDRKRRVHLGTIGCSLDNSVFKKKVNTANNSPGVAPAEPHSRTDLQRFLRGLWAATNASANSCWELGGLWFGGVLVHGGAPRAETSSPRIKGPDVWGDPQRGSAAVPWGEGVLGVLLVLVCSVCECVYVHL